MLGSDVQARNETFYSKAYSVRGVVPMVAKYFLSFDQLSKTRPNLYFLRLIPGFANSLRILDFGFGHGTLLGRIPRRHVLAGCELSADAIANLRRLFSLLRRPVSVVPLGELGGPALEPRYDVICCSHVLEHVPNARELLSSFRSLLATNGYLLLNLPINEVWQDPNHARAFTEESAIALLQARGFAMVERKTTDRWSGFLLYHERVAKDLPKLLCRALRLALALSPACLVRWSELLLPDRYLHQQLLILAKRA